jgi:NTE family protein
MVEAFNIIQDRISRARLAGDPPDLSVQPKLGHIGLSEFHRADEAIKIGYEATKARIAELERLQTVMV